MADTGLLSTGGRQAGHVGRWLVASMLVVLLVACVHAPRRAVVELPALQLPPAAFGNVVSVQQRLYFSFGAHQREMDALLEVDAEEVRLVVQAMGQVGVRLFWDGKQLQQQRAQWLPPQVRAERVLDDLQFTLWPAASIRAALPREWALREEDGVRELLRDGQVWLSVSKAVDGRMLLINHAEGYRLEIEGPANGGTP